ncbi:hypothetical protein GCM10009840_29610 [Pseudolysinimonas kribbensis]|uniref:DNA-binding protein n=1 Tax=Pseudolysinimonas kribbensis TaxID=433641 RepID=A0ABQ6K6X7_9MICO|nr:OB-fold domain-containing protein [Pseudolysinimonas kribbensis]GMA96203.1 hypothetical protein GCM10025881_30270 [Pseudolysinimonas kribbensis]
MSRVPMASPRGEEERARRALAAGAIAFQVCEECGAAIWYPRTVCPACMSGALRWARSAGRGAVHSLTTLHRAGHPDREAELPYTVALVDLDEGIRIIGDLADGLRIGDRVGAEVAADGVRFVSADGEPAGGADAR